MHPRSQLILKAVQIFQYSMTMLVEKKRRRMGMMMMMLQQFPIIALTPSLQRLLLQRLVPMRMSLQRLMMCRAGGRWTGKPSEQMVGIKVD